MAWPGSPDPARDGPACSCLPSRRPRSLPRGRCTALAAALAIQVWAPARAHAADPEEPQPAAPSPVWPAGQPPVPAPGGVGPSQPASGAAPGEIPIVTTPPPEETTPATPTQTGPAPATGAQPAPGGTSAVPQPGATGVTPGGPPAAPRAAPAGAPRPAPPGPGLESGPCTTVELNGDEMGCANDVCHVTGNVTLTCESMRLWARTLDVTFTKDGQFAGAVAHGDVLLVDGARVINCDSMTLAADRVQARLEDATVHVKRLPLKLSPAGVPTGRDSSMFTGAVVQRLTRDRLHIADATYTMCDCSPAPPSWHLHASSIDATLGDRLTAYWPVFWIRPFGLLDVPLTPPLPPLSMPLTSRAAGFVAPRIALYAPPYPTIDAPFFIPLGRSWDLTLAPGLRTDWTRTHGFAPGDWGAPRLGARLRYAPDPGTTGEWDAQWTHDGQQVALLRRAGAEGDAACRADPSACSDAGLVDRVSVHAAHKTDFSENLRLLANVDWVSDDRYLQDFAVGIQVAQYVPSRVALAWRSPLLAGSLSAEYLERMGTAGNVRNLDPAEYRAPQHGPDALLRLEPFPLGGGVMAEGEVSFDRFGAFTSASPAVSPALFVTRAAPALAYASGLGPVALRARAAFDGAVLSGDGGITDPTEALAAVADADASLSLARRFGDYLHVVTPRLSYRAIPWRSGPALSTLTYRKSSATGEALVSISDLDELLRRDAVEHQGMITLVQDLYAGAGRTVTRIARLELSQPADLRTGSLLPLRVAASVSRPTWGSASMEADLYLPGIGATHPPAAVGGVIQPDRERVLRDLVAGVASPPIGPLTLALSYNRFSPESSRLLRTIYELEAPLDRRVPGAGWANYLGFAAAGRLPPRLVLSYSSEYYLRYPGQLPNSALPEAEQPGFTQHRVQLDYHSPCDCWDVRFLFVFPRVTVKGQNPFQMSFLISVAGYGIGG